MIKFYIVGDLGYLSSTGDCVANYFRDKKTQGNSILAITQNITIENGDIPEKKAAEVIDVLVIGKEEIYIVKTQDTFKFHGLLRESNMRLKKFFEQAEAYVRKEFDAQNKEIKRLFVTDELSFIVF